MTEAKRAAIYLRISKKPNGEEDAKASHSVEDQRVRCEALCEANGYEAVASFVDDGVSAFRSRRDRPGYTELKAALAAGVFDVLVFDRQDRLARDQTETLEFVAACRRAGLEWHSVQEGHIDLSEPMQVLFAIFRGGEAESYSAKINTNSRNRNTAKRDQGLPGAGQRPFGWTKAERFEGYHQDLIPEESDLVRRGTEMILSGGSTYQVAKMFQDSGVKTVRGKEWVPANVAALLKRWRNAGWVEHDDKPYTEAIWPAIVSLEDVRNVRTILGQGRIPGRWRVPTMLCSGIARCHCGLSLMVTGDDDGTKAYRCSGVINNTAEPGKVHVTIRSEILDPMARAAVVDAYFTRPASSGAAKAEAASLARIYERQNVLRADRTHVQQLARERIYTPSEASAEIAKIETEIEKLDGEARTLAASSAHAALLAESMNSLTVGLDVDAAPDATNAMRLGFVRAAMRDGASREDALNSLADAPWLSYDKNGNPVHEVDPALWAAVAARFDAMTLEPQRDLMRSLITIKIVPGRGPKRVLIAPVEAVAVPA